jgi:hypothetical protein
MVPSSGISAGCAQTVTAAASAPIRGAKRMNWIVSPRPW